MRILMVCLGNICRSPLAEGILKHTLKKRRLDWEVDSAGTSGWHDGELPDKRAIAIAQIHNISIADQKSRQFSTVDFDRFDVILAMDSSNYQDIIALAKNEKEKEKVHLIMNFIAPKKNIAVPDPYYNNGFPKVYQMLENACEKVIDYYTEIND